ncbi:MAG: hypothetical protein U0797_30235 [Gemmataceae bacterium]
MTGSGNHPLPVSDDHPRCPSRTGRAATALHHTGLVATGAAVGGLLRWGVGEAFRGSLGVGFPFGTLFINVTGCLFLGWFGKHRSTGCPAAPRSCGCSSRSGSVAPTPRSPATSWKRTTF